MPIGFAIDPDQGLSPEDELQLVRLAAGLGYDSAWTPSGPDTAAFNRCMRWHEASGLPTGISAVPASGQSPAFYAGEAERLWEATGGAFTLVLGSGQMTRPAAGMRRYFAEVRHQLAGAFPLYLAALGPLMLSLAGQVADGVALNWCSSEQVRWSRKRVEQGARSAERPMPEVIQYIRTAVDQDERLAQRTVASAARRYLRVPAYERHFERIGVARDLGTSSERDDIALGFVHKIGAAGKPGQTREQFERLAQGLDLPIVRVLVVKRGDAESARRVLEECRPG